MLLNQLLILSVTVFNEVKLYKRKREIKEQDRIFPFYFCQFP